MRLSYFGYAHPFGENQMYGAERVIWYLIRELKKMGHECVVFSVRGCNLPGFEYVPVSEPWRDEVDVHYEALKRYERQNGVTFDIIHSYMASGKISLEMRQSRPYCLEPFFPFDRWTENIIAYSHKLNAVNGGRGMVIHFGLPEDYYSDWGREAEDYLCWIGRIDIGKGLDIAIEVAKRAGKRLIVMGHAYHYPHFVEKMWSHFDGDRVIWLRGVTDSVKVRVMKKAKALLSTNWDRFHEMFGLINIEALACGCPVIGWGNMLEPSAINFGTGGEIIEHGKQGFINEYRDYDEDQKEVSIQNGVEYVGRIGEIDREECRKLYLEKFTAKQMAEKHVMYYKMILNEWGR